MILWASGSGIGVGRCSRLQRGVRVIAMPDAGLKTKGCIEVPLSASVLPLLVPGVGVVVFIHRRCISDGLEVTHSVISATRELFSTAKGLED
jgi:hypothetical protein